MLDLTRCFLFVFLILLGCTTGSYGTDTSRIKAKITPSGIFASGSNMTLYCSLTNNDASMNISSGSLKFSTDNVNLTDSIVSSVLNDSTLQLMVTGVTRSISSSNISCLLNDTVRDTIMITVADKPRTPYITECRVHNWKTLTCIWELQDTGIDTNFSLMWRRTRGGDWCACPVPHHNSCSWYSKWQNDKDRYYEAEYFVMLYENVTGKLHPLPETYKHFKSTDIVEPDPVSNVLVKQESSKSAVVSWKSPHDDKKLLYHISYESPVSDVNVTYTNSSSIILEDLIPWITYKVTISCIPLIRVRGPAYNATGFWSKNSSITFTTLEDVPAKNPLLASGGFRVKAVNDSHRHIQLFIRPVDVRSSNGNISSYRIKCTTKNTKDSVEKIVYPKFSADVELLNYNDYNITVEAGTKMGFNEMLIPQPIFIQQQNSILPYPSRFVVQSKNMLLYLFNWSSVSNATSYTLYWCSAYYYRFECLGSMNWKTFPSTQTSEELNLTIYETGKLLNFAISVEMELPSGETVSSGMLISNCTFIINGDVKAPRHLEVLKRESDSVTLTWRSPNEEICNRRAYISHYIVEYCLKSMCNIKNDTLNSSVESVEIAGLVPGEAYEARVKSISDRGKASSFTEVREISPHEESGFSQSMAIMISIITIAVTLFCCLILLVLKHYYGWWTKEINIKLPKMYVPRSTKVEGESGYTCFQPSLSLSTNSDGDIVHLNDQKSDINGNGHKNTMLLFNASKNDVRTAVCYVNDMRNISSSESGEETPSPLSSGEFSRPCANLFCGYPSERNASGGSASVSGYNLIFEKPPSETSATSIEHTD